MKNRHNYEAILPEKSEPCNLLNSENFAITMTYFSVGLAMSFISTPLNVYMVRTLNAEPQMQITIGILRFLPWSMKLLFGFLSDAVPMWGMHRKPYLAIGAVLYSTILTLFSVLATHSVILLAICVFLSTVGIIQMDVMADTMCVERSRFEPEEHRGQMQASFYTIRFGGNLLGAIAGGLLCSVDFGWSMTFFQIAFINGIIPMVLVAPWLFSLREKYHKSVDINPHAIEEVEMAQQQRSTTTRDVDGGEGDVEMHSPLTVDTSSLHSHSASGLSPLPTPPPIFIAGNKIASDISFLKLHSALKAQYHSVTTTEQHPLEHAKSPLRDDTAESPTSEYQNVVVPCSPEIVNEDIENPTIVSVQHQIQQIWMTVQLRSVWRPMAFIYVYNILQVPNVAWQSYLQLSLHFPAWVLGLTVVLGSAMTFAGTLAYKFVFYKSSWRMIYLYTTMLTTFFSFMQLLLIFQINTTYLHLNNYLFSVGDDVIASYIAGIQFLPICAMYMRLCPEGSEGASYAMLTTFANMGLICSYNVGSSMSTLWDVSNEAMRRGDVSGLWKLCTLTSAMSVLPLTLLFLLPRTKQDEQHMADSQVRSKLGGVMFLSVLFGSMLWTVLSAIFRLQAVDE